MSLISVCILVVFLLLGVSWLRIRGFYHALSACRYFFSQPSLMKHLEMSDSVRDYFKAKVDEHLHYYPLWITFGVFCFVDTFLLWLILPQPQWTYAIVALCSTLAIFFTKALTLDTNWVRGLLGEFAGASARAAREALGQMRVHLEQAVKDFGITLEEGEMTLGDLHKALEESEKLHQLELFDKDKPNDKE